MTSFNIAKTMLLVILVTGCASYVPYSGSERVTTFSPYVWPGETTTHVVGKHETLNEIAQKYNSNMTVIVKMNPESFGRNNQPIPGSRLEIPLRDSFTLPGLFKRE